MGEIHTNIFSRKDLDVQKMNRYPAKCSRAFSLLELIIVVVIIGIIAAIAIPRLSRGTTGDEESALIGDLRILREAIEYYKVEHRNSLPDKDNIADQLTKYTSISGAVSDTRDTVHIYGPYIAGVPPLPIGERTGNTGIATKNGSGVGWIYKKNTGHLYANTKNNEKDASGVKYKDY